MSDISYPVHVLVKRPDGSSEAVRVGTAVRAGDGFRLTLGELSIGGIPDAAPAPRRSAPPAAGGDGMVFPPYGQSRGAPIAGASMKDLEFYLSGCKRTLADPAKARWHEKERSLMAAIEAEIARQTGGGGGGRSEAGRAQAGSPAAQDFDAPPDYSDDDIPF